MSRSSLFLATETHSSFVSEKKCYRETFFFLALSIAIIGHKHFAQNMVVRRVM